MDQTDNIVDQRIGADSVGQTALVVASRLWFREGLKGLLQASGIVSVSDGATVEIAFAGLGSDARPDVGIVSLEGDDDRMLRDLETLARWRAQWPDIKWVVLSSSLHPALLMAALEARVDGLFHVDISEHVLQRSVELILLGQTLFPPELSRLLLNASRSMLPGVSDSGHAMRAQNSTSPNPERGHEPAVMLSPREHQILQCLVAGDPNKVIARKLEIAEATVKVHIKGLLRKVKASNRTQAAIWAMNQRSEPAAIEVARMAAPALSMSATLLPFHTPAAASHAHSAFAASPGLPPGLPGTGLSGTSLTNGSHVPAELAGGCN